MFGLGTAVLKCQIIRISEILEIGLREFCCSSLPTHPPTYLPTYVPIYPPNHLLMHQPVYLPMVSVCMHTHTYMYVGIYVAFHLSVQH